MPVHFSFYYRLPLAVYFEAEAGLPSRHLSFDSGIQRLQRGMVRKSLPVFHVTAVCPQLHLLMSFLGVGTPVLPLVVAVLRISVLAHASVVEEVVSSLAGLRPLGGTAR